jgi:predicted double-glycine peptidase
MPSDFASMTIAATRRGLLAGLLLAGAAPGGVANAAPPVRSLLEIRQANVVMQKFDLSCGAAALTTLLNHQHGERLTEREVATGLMRRVDYVQDPSLVQRREGFSLLDLKRYVEGRGYEGIGYGGLEWDDLAALAPVMVPVNLGGYNHFVIFRGVLGDQAVLADPAWGNRRLPIATFRTAWVDYPGLGQVGFVVRRRAASVPSAPQAPPSLPPASLPSEPP